jgi:hypothetical protein
VAVACRIVRIDDDIANAPASVTVRAESAHNLAMLVSLWLAIAAQVPLGWAGDLPAAKAKADSMVLLVDDGGSGFGSAVRTALESDGKLRWVEAPAISLNDAAAAAGCAAVDEACGDQIARTLGASSGVLLLITDEGGVRATIRGGPKVGKKSAPASSFVVPANDATHPINMRFEMTVQAIASAVRAHVQRTQPPAVVWLLGPAGTTAKIDSSIDVTLPSTRDDLSPGEHVVQVGNVGVPVNVVVGEVVIVHAPVPNVPQATPTDAPSGGAVPAKVSSLSPWVLPVGIAAGVLAVAGMAVGINGSVFVNKSYEYDNGKWRVEAGEYARSPDACSYPLSFCDGVIVRNDKAFEDHFNRMQTMMFIGYVVGGVGVAGVVAATTVAVLGTGEE